MIVVIFEVTPHAEYRQAYFDLATELRPLLNDIDGFISIERYASITNPEKILSLSLWRNEEAVLRWRNVEAHREAQHAGKSALFADYQLKVAQVIRAYGMEKDNKADHVQA
jgi:heme-degrading monooxygenase HmoA